MLRILLGLSLILSGLTLSAHAEESTLAVFKSDIQPVLYIHPYGEGQVLYLTLGHCRGKYDMQPLMEEYPVPEEGAWRTEEFYELLRRGIQWAMTPAS